MSEEAVAPGSIRFINWKTCSPKVILFTSRKMFSLCNCVKLEGRLMQKNSLLFHSKQIYSKVWLKNSLKYNQNQNMDKRVIKSRSWVFLDQKKSNMWIKPPGVTYTPDVKVCLLQDQTHDGFQWHIKCRYNHLSRTCLTSKHVFFPHIIQDLQINVQKMWRVE